MVADPAAQDLAALNREIWALEQRGEDLLAAMARGRKAQALARDQRFAEAAEELGRAEQLARHARRQDLQARYLLAQGLTMARTRALWDAARGVLARAAALGRLLEDAPLELTALRRELDLCLLDGPPASAHSKAGWLAGRAQELGRPAEELDALRCRAMLAVELGQPAAALVDLDRAVLLAQGGAAPEAPVALDRALVRESLLGGDLGRVLGDLHAHGLRSEPLERLLAGLASGEVEGLEPLPEDGGVVCALSRAALAYARQARLDALEALLEARARSARTRDRVAAQAVAGVLGAWERAWTAEGMAQVVVELEQRRSQAPRAG